MRKPEAISLQFYGDPERNQTIANVLGTAVTDGAFEISPDELFDVLDSVRHGDPLYVVVEPAEQETTGKAETIQPERLSPHTETTYTTADGTITVFSDRPSIVVNGETIALTPWQNQFFRTLLENAGTTVPYSKLGSHKQLRDRAQSLTGLLSTVRRRLADKVTIYTERRVGLRIERAPNVDD